MSIFGTIMEKIFHSADAKPAVGPTDVSSAAPSAAPESTAASSGTSASTTVDVKAVLTQLAATKGGGGNWDTSIVDLLKLLDLDSSLGARAALADELNTHAGANGAAEQNVALHKAVMEKLADNGGKVPDSMRR